MNIKHYIHTQRITNLLLFALIFINIGPYLLNLGSLWHGDWISQYYPWLYEFKKSLSLNTLPFWSPNLGGGFPLLAEGLSGCLYPLNIILLKILPIPVFVNISIIIHFLILGLFFTKWMNFFKKITFAEKATIFLVICFGAFGGGLSFGGLAPQRAFTFFIVQLYFVTAYLVKQKNKYLLLNGLTAGIGLLSGYIQITIIGNSFLLFYLSFKTQNVKQILKYLLYLSPSIILFFPQLTETMTLIRYTNREHITQQIMMTNSLNPLSLSTLFFPQFTNIFRTNIYMSLPIAISALYVFIKTSKFLILKISVVIFFIISLGKWFPLNYILYYVPFLNKIRGQNKWSIVSYIIFLFFGIYGLPLLYKNKHYLIGILLKLTIPFYLLILFIHFVFIYLKTHIIFIGKFLAKKYIFGSSAHPQSLQYYYNKIDSFYEIILEATNIFNFQLIFSAIIIVLLIILLKKINNQKTFINLVLLLICFDITIFNFVAGLNSGLSYSKIYSQETLFNQIFLEHSRVVTYLPDPIPSEKIVQYVPNINLAYNVDSLGIYTPLAIQKLKKYFIDIQLVNDAFGRKPVMIKTFEENIPKLQKSSVTHIISEKPLTHKDLTLVGSLDKVLLYKLNNSNPLLFTNEKDVLRLNQIKTINNGIYFTYYAQDNIEATLNYTYHPNLSALLNNTTYLEIKQDEFSPFIKISLPKGENSIKIKYNFLKRHEKKIQN